jgi:hypothetical protein
MTSTAAKNIELCIQNFVAIGGRANGVIRYIDKGQYQKAKHYATEMLKIAEEMIAKLKEGYEEERK